MKSYQSCLFPMLQVLYNEYLKTNQFSDIDEPEHLKMFIKSYNKATSEEEKIEAIKIALSESSNCKLCLSCKKCAKLFYLEIAKLSITNYDNSYFEQLHKETSDECGMLSFRKAPPLLERHFDNANSSKKHYEQKNKQKNNGDIIDKIIVLKGMSSSSPYIYNNMFASKQYTGGGLYINWKGTGIAIDPGYGFVENMYKNRISIYDIDNVIVTHSHIDHTNDMRIIDDLNYTFPKKDKLKWYVDNETEQYFRQGLNKKRNEFYSISPSDFGQDIYINENISFKPFSTVHMREDVENSKEYKKNTFGIVITLRDGENIWNVGYTSDTKYYDELNNHLDHCDIIIANISGIYLDDFLLINPKKNHLGYFGCYNLINNIKNAPKIFVVSEFWNGTTDLRFDVCKTLYDETCAEYMKILPGDIGLHMDIKNYMIKCSKCGCYEYYKDIKLIRPSEDFGEITYVCKNCIY